MKLLIEAPALVDVRCAGCFFFWTALFDEGVERLDHIECPACRLALGQIQELAA